MTPGVGDERVEVVGEDGAVLEVVTRAEMRARHLRHRAVCIVVVDIAGERLLAHRRADWKDVWPSRWDIGFGGVVGAGEAWLAAAHRELAEEAGIEAALTPIGSGHYADDDVAEVAELYLARSEGPFSFPDGEVAEVQWIAVGELERWLAERPHCPDSATLVPARLRAALARGAGL